MARTNSRRKVVQKLMSLTVARVHSRKRRAKRSCSFYFRIDLSTLRHCASLIESLSTQKSQLSIHLQVNKRTNTISSMVVLAQLLPNETRRFWSLSVALLHWQRSIEFRTLSHLMYTTRLFFKFVYTDGCVHPSQELVESDIKPKSKSKSKAKKAPAVAETTPAAAAAVKA